MIFILTLLANILIPGIILTLYFRNKLSGRSSLQKINKEIETLITELNQYTENNITLIEDKISQANEIIEKLKSFPPLLEEIEIAKKILKELTEKIERQETKLEEKQETRKDLSVREKIILLSSSGKKIPEIAQQVDMSYGEVELILTLHKHSIKNSTQTNH